MDKILENVKKELKEIGEKGLTANNLDTVEKLSKILKDIKTFEAMEEGGQEMDYRGDDYGRRYRTGDGDYGRMYRDNDYRNQYDGGDYGRRGGYRGLKDKVMRMMDGVDMYEYGRDRYMHGDSETRVHEGLEKLMYALCMFVESTMEFAETPQEKEIIRKHLQKLQHI